MIGQVQELCGVQSSGSVRYLLRLNVLLAADPAVKSQLLHSTHVIDVGVKSWYRSITKQVIDAQSLVLELEPSTWHLTLDAADTNYSYV